jgi:hypothetical protein
MNTFAFLSEFGTDYWLDRGRFNTLASKYVCDFNAYWWGETCRFEDRLRAKFAGDTILVSDHVPPSKSFSIWPKERPAIDRLCSACMEYLAQEHPDASIVIASPLGYPLGAGRLVLTTKGTWMDLDLARWFVEQTASLDLSVPEPSEFEKRLRRSDVRTALPWLTESSGRSVSSQEFWEITYTGGGLQRIEDSKIKRKDGYRLGSEIVGHLCDRYWILHEDESCEVYISHSLPKHRIIKVECTRDVCDSTFVAGVLRIISGIDETWAVRFSVFASLIEDDSYLGGLIVMPDGNFILEVGEQM